MESNFEVETKNLKKEVLVRLVRAFLSDNFPENTRLIPYDMRPKGAEVPFRCCIYKERAILRSRTIAGLGFAMEQDDERTSLRDFATKATQREKAEHDPLTVLQNACKGCPSSRVLITELCQGCVARPCIKTCPFGAIAHVDGRSVIDESKCKKCGKCMQVCPYKAIVRTVVPCEEACPVGAISKNADGFSTIDKTKCISCGKCVSACPFGAVHAKSQIIDVLSRIKEGKKVIAMVAPAFLGYLPCAPNKLKSAFGKIGFAQTWEVAQGADITATTEAHDFAERMKAGAPFMTTSCCAAYNELVKKHIPEMKPYVSETKTPLFYTAELVKQKYPDAVTVFISPCFAKRREVLDNPNVDYVLNFAEVDAIFTGMNIDFDACEVAPFDYQSSKEARNFALIGGVAESVRSALPDALAAQLKPVVVAGLDKVAVRDLKLYAKTGKCDSGNLIEIMSCAGGCVSGNACPGNHKKAHQKVADYADESFSLKEKRK